MKTWCLFVLAVLYSAFVSIALAGFPKDGCFSESILIDAFEKGRSLVVAEILSVYEEKHTDFHCYTAKVMRPIILGDLTKNDMLDALELFAGASYGSALKPGSTYALFITKDCPYHFSWAHRDDVIKVDISEKENLQALIEAADRAYAKASIREFRKGKGPEKVELPALPEKIISLCESFRANPINRAEFAKRIYESDIGSKLDDSTPFLSYRVYLPPKIVLSREQMVFLLGKPTQKCGWTYHWFCGQDKSVAVPEKYVGILSVTFDKSENGIRVLYDTHQRVKWARFSEKRAGPAKVSEEAKAVMSQFQQALRESDWDKALGFCSENVKSKASDYGSAEAFFRGVVPVDEIVSLPRFQTSGGKYNREGQQVEYRCFLRLPTADSEETVDWVWTVGKSDSGWVIGFETISLTRHIEKEHLRRLQEKERARERLEQLQRGLETRLVPLSKEFVVGGPMLFRVEMTNVSDSPITYRRGSVMVNDPMIVIGSNGESIKYVDASYQTASRREVIPPGETIILADKYDVMSQYRIIEPGRYTFQFNGRPREIKRSNIVEVDIKPGKLSYADSIVERLIPVLPEGWVFTRTLLPRKQPSPENPSKALIVHLIGKRGRKGVDEGISVLILVSPTEDEIAPEPEWFTGHLWGESKWGPVYVEAFDAELLWPDYREQIIKALDIREVEPD